MYRTADFQFSRGPEPPLPVPLPVGQVANVPNLHESVFGCNEARDVKSVSQPFSPHPAKEAFEIGGHHRYRDHPRVVEKRVLLLHISQIVKPARRFRPRSHRPRIISETAHQEIPDSLDIVA